MVSVARVILLKFLFAIHVFACALPSFHVNVSFRIVYQENIRKHQDVKLVSDKRKFKRLTS